MPGCLSLRRSADGLSATAAVRDLSVADTEALAARLGADIEREGLGPGGHLPGDPFVNSVLRITLTYFSMVPLQKWLSITGVLLIALALLMRSPPFAIAAVLGVVFLVMVPALLGGASMRMGSSRAVLHLRPYSRWRMLAAALLTVCLMTLVCVFIMWAAMLAGVGPTNGDTAAPPLTLAEFALAIWGGLSILWLVSFVGSGSGMWVMLFGIWLHHHDFKQVGATEGPWLAANCAGHSGRGLLGGVRILVSAGTAGATPRTNEQLLSHGNGRKQYRRLVQLLDRIT